MEFFSKVPAAMLGTMITVLFCRTLSAVQTSGCPIASRRVSRRTPYLEYLSPCARPLKRSLPLDRATWPSSRLSGITTALHRHSTPVMLLLSPVGIRLVDRTGNCERATGNSIVSRRIKP